MQKSVPMKATFIYTENFGVRIEPELKEEMRQLDAQGVDVPELAREALREAVRKAKVNKAS